MSAAITLFILTVLLFVQSGGRTHRDWGSIDTRTFSHCCEVYLWHGPSSSRPCPALPWRGQTNIEELQRWCCPSRSTQFPVQTHTHTQTQASGGPEHITVTLGESVPRRLHRVQLRCTAHFHIPVANRDDEAIWSNGLRAFGSLSCKQTAAMSVSSC